MKIHSSLQAYNASASTFATGYAASNVAISQVLKSWRTTAITAQTLTLDLGAMMTPASLLIQEANWATALVESSPDNTAWTSRGTLTNSRDITGRYKGLLELTGTYRYLRLTIGVQTVLDGAAYFSVGAAYVFLLSEAASIAPEWGISQQVSRPQALYALANGRSVNFSEGNSYITLNGRAPNKPSDDAARVLRLAQAGVIAIDFELPLNRERVWPVQSFEDQFTQTLEGPSLWPLEFVLKEIV